MRKSGIAGGIGSGKTGVAMCFEVLGIPVYYADLQAKKLMLLEPIKSKLISLFGKETYINGNLNKKFISEKLFNHKEYRKKINQIVHPQVHNDFDIWAKKQESKWVIIEAAIMFETGYYKTLDSTIIVQADESERIKRIMKRDNISKMKAVKRIDSQKNIVKFAHLATYLIKNNNKDEVLPQVLNIYNKEINNG